MNDQVVSMDWGRSLHREFRPFKVCEKPLVEQNAYVIRCPLAEGEPLEIPMMGEQPKYSVVVEDSVARGIRGVEFSMPFDRDKVCDESGVSAADVELALLLKDFKTRNVLVVQRWPLATAPERFEIPVERLAEISLVDDFEIGVVAYLKHAQKAQPGIATSKGAVLARCDLTITIETESGPDFDVTTITQDELESLGYGRNALFIVEWTDEEDFSRPAKEVFSVRVNEVAAQKLMQVTGTNTFGSAFYRQMMADIMFQVSQKIFAKGIDPGWPDISVGKTLLKFIEKNSGVVPEKLEQYAKNEIDRLQAIVQSSLELSTAVQNAALAGRN